VLERLDVRQLLLADHLGHHGSGGRPSDLGQSDTAEFVGDGRQYPNARVRVTAGDVADPDVLGDREPQFRLWHMRTSSPRNPSVLPNMFGTVALPPVPQASTVEAE